jgi:hypothetical protein
MESADHPYLTTYMHMRGDQKMHLFVLDWLVRTVGQKHEQLCGGQASSYTVSFCFAYLINGSSETHP